MTHPRYEFSKINKNHTDKEIRKLWNDFEDVPMNPETEQIETDFLHFKAGTDKETIWHWFDKNYSKGINSLLYD